MGLVSRRISDKRVLKLLRQWLRAGVMEAEEVKASTLGTPQGGVISPLLANVYLDALDGVWERQCVHLGRLIRYADDFGAACNGTDPAGASPATASVRMAVQRYPTPKAGDRVGASSGVNVLAAVQPAGPDRGASSSGGRSTTRTLPHRNRRSRESGRGSTEMPSPAKSDEGQWRWGSSDRDTRRISRCKGGGTWKRISNPKQGRSLDWPVGRVLRISDAKSKDGRETGGSGRSSVDVRYRTNRAERRTRGLAWFRTDGEAGPGMPRGQPDQTVRVAKRNEVPGKRRRKPPAGRSRLQGTRAWSRTGENSPYGTLALPGSVWVRGTPDKQPNGHSDPAYVLPPQNLPAGTSRRSPPPAACLRMASFFTSTPSGAGFWAPGDPHETLKTRNLRGGARNGARPEAIWHRRHESAGNGKSLAYTYARALYSTRVVPHAGGCRGGTASAPRHSRALAADAPSGEDAVGGSGCWERRFRVPGLSPSDRPLALQTRAGVSVPLAVTQGHEGHPDQDPGPHRSPKTKRDEGHPRGDRGPQPDSSRMGQLLSDGQRLEEVPSHRPMRHGPAPKAARGARWTAEEPTGRKAVPEDGLAPHSLRSGSRPLQVDGNDSLPGPDERSMSNTQRSSESRVREIRTHGLIGGSWKRGRLRGYRT